MRLQTMIIAGALSLGACETNEAVDPIEVTRSDLAGTYDLITVGQTPTNQLDAEYCLDSELSMQSDGDFEIHHAFVERTASGTNAACRTDAGRFQIDVYWRGRFENTSTLVVMTIEESETALTVGDSTVASTVADNTELVGEYNPQTDRLVMQFPNIWAFNPHGGSGGKISIGGESRGLGGGILIFDR